LNHYDLSGRTAVVTGGTGGIGQGIAQRLRSGGARVVLWDLMPPVQPDPADHFIAVDVTGENSVRAAVQHTLRECGGIDILVNSAGIVGPVAPVADYALADWQRVLAINLTGVFLCCREVVPQMQARNRGRIVNLASIAGKEGNAGQSAYSAAKAGVIALTKSLGKELAATDIRVNCIAPAMVATPLLAQMTDAKRAENFAKIPVGRAGTVDEIAALACWLASDECSFCTGAGFDASGGRATY
jgi:3-oxoacyl-[acyl-carrier protein] reductase